VREAVAKVQDAGIKVIMVIGDHLTTAATIAREIELGRLTRRIIEGSKFETHGRG
jgi:magnesium-transporting ATPase (P-type)